MGCSYSSSSNGKNDNYIIGILNVYPPDENQELEDILNIALPAKLISSYENYQQDSKDVNEKEIKQAEIRIEDEVFPFSYEHELKPGKYTVKISFKKPLKNASCLFAMCDYEVLDLSHFNSDDLTDLSHIFTGCMNLKVVFLNDLKTDKVTTMEHMFFSCENLTDIDCSSFNTENVTNVNGMFMGCSLLKIIRCRNFNFLKIKEFVQVFSDCESLRYIDLANCTTSDALTSLYMAFEGCKKLTHLNISKFDFSKVTEITNMCTNCESLKELTFPENINKDIITDCDHVFEGCNSLNEKGVNIDNNFYKFLRSKD